MRTDRVDAVVLGGGVAGLAAGHYLAALGRRVVVLESNAEIGGLAGSFVHQGFTLDHGPHKFSSTLPGVVDDVRNLLSESGTDLIRHERRQAMFLREQVVGFPLNPIEVAQVVGPRDALGLTGGFLSASVARLFAGDSRASFASFSRRRFGRAGYELVFGPMAHKIWGDPELLSWELAALRLPEIGLAQLVGNLWRGSEGSANEFFYPRGGFNRIPQAFRRAIETAGGEVVTNARVRGVECRSNRIASLEAEVLGRDPLHLRPELIVSSIPLVALGRLLEDRPDGAVSGAAARLPARNVVLVYFFLRGEPVLGVHWIFFPESRFAFNRVSEPKQMSEELGPPGQTAICCDLTMDDDDDLWRGSDEAMAASCWHDLVSTGLVSGALPRFLVKRFREFYPVYGRTYRQSMSGLLDALEGYDNLVLTGRLGAFNYNNTDHCVDMGRFIAELLANGERPSSIRRRLDERVRAYRIVD